MGCFRPESLYDLYWSHQFGIRYCNLSGIVVCVRLYFVGTSDTVPVRMVHRRITLADIDCPYDPYSENSVYPKPCNLAGNRADCTCHGYRYTDSVYFTWTLHRAGIFTAQLFPLVDWHFAGLLHTDTTGQELVYPPFCEMAIKYFVCTYFNQWVHTNVLRSGPIPFRVSDFQCDGKEEGSCRIPFSSIVKPPNP